MTLLRPIKLGALELPNNIWMSPLCGVTDIPFRTLVREQGAGLTHTQMVSCAALVRGGMKDKRTRAIMELRDDETPVGIQLFGCEPAEMAESARLAELEGADLVSINFGCPVPKVVKHNGGSAMLKDPASVEAVTRAVVDHTSKPVVPKIRIGWDAASVNAIEICQRIEQSGASAVVIHGRTRAQGYSGSADWDVITQVKRAVKIPVIGNGDCFTPEDVELRLRQSGVDGVMLGRGAMGNPWLFRRTLKHLAGEASEAPTGLERIAGLRRHLSLAFEYRGTHALAEMRKHAMWYLKGLPRSSEARQKINQTLDYQAILGILDDYSAWLAANPEAPVVDRQAGVAELDNAVLEVA